MSLSKTIVVGHLGKDAIVKEVNGKKVINFSVAHSESYTDKQGAKQTKTTWFECAKWGENANVAPYLTKGMLVAVEGTVEASAYADKEGKPAASLKLNVFALNLLGSSNGTAAQPAAAQAAPPPPPPAPVWNGTAWVIPTAAQPKDDKLPF